MYCCTPKAALQSCGGGGGLSSTTTSVQHPLGLCYGCHRTTAPVRSPTHRLQVEKEKRVIEPIKCMRSPHTSYRWRGERAIEPIKCMRSPHTSYRWRGESETLEPIKWYALSTHQLQVERRKRVIEPIKCMRLTTHQLQVEMRESSRANSSVFARHHNSYRWRGRESHRANQV